MSKFKKTKKIKEGVFISQPLNFNHIGHLSSQEIPSATGDITETVTEPPTPCQGTDMSQVVQKMLKSCDFQETLRNIVREEMTAVLEKERGTMLKEIESLRQPPPPCNAVLTAPDQVKDVHLKDSTSSLSSNPFTTDEIDSDPNVSARFRNPLYDLNGQQKHKPNPAPRNRRVRDLQCSDGDSQTEVKEVYRYKFGPKSVLRLSRDDERECLSQALQANIVRLVDRLQLNSSALPDQLISAGHMTEDECRMMRSEIKSRKDQVRYLVSRTKCRDLNDIEKFLELIENEVPDIVTKINQQFEENKRNNIKCTTCALCQCMNNIDIKDVVDILWSIRAVSDGFYNEVIACNKPRGSQECLWKSLVDICNCKQSREKRKVYDILFDYMRRKGNFDFILKPLDVMLDKHGRLECNCHFSLKVSFSDRGSYGVQSSCSPRSSWSESRQSTFSGEYSQEIEQVRETLGLKNRKLERQHSFEDKSEETISKRGGMLRAGSLDMLETIQEETCKPSGKSCRKGIDFVFQTMEFHGPVDNNRDFRPYINVDENENVAVRKNSPSQRRGFEVLQGFDQNRSSEA